MNFEEKALESVSVESGKWIFNVFFVDGIFEGGGEYLE